MSLSGQFGEVLDLARLQRYISDLTERGVPVPEDDVAAVKFAKLDLDALGPESGLV